VDASNFIVKLMNMISTASSKPLNFVFRWDAGKRIGNGHYMRCMVLSTELLLRGHSVIVLTRQVPQALQAVLSQLGVVARVISPGSDGLDILDEINGATRIDWLVIDHYDIDIQWERLARRFTSRIMVIDDLANRPHDCDLLLDQNVPNGLHKGYNEMVPENCVRAIGWSHLLARPGFYTHNFQVRSGTLVFLGGGDHSHALSALMDQLIERTQYHPLKILVSSDYLPLAHWQSVVAGCGQVFCDVLDPVALYRSAHLAVVRCGFVSYELALLGIPAVHIYATPVQAAVALELERFAMGVALQELQLPDTALLDEAMQRASKMNPQPLNETYTPGAKVVADLLEHNHEHH
jgi:UDP-2,4-diacetamido-2,4,6-trideoxy-beta-L-altropyranose hydrolase